jgi:hypothetical protein
MSAFEDVFRNYGEQMSDFLKADKLYRLLIAHAFDGTEAFEVVDHELRGLELEDAAKAIKAALLKIYRDSVPVHVAVELDMALLEQEGRP